MRRGCIGKRVLWFIFGGDSRGKERILGATFVWDADMALLRVWGFGLGRFWRWEYDKRLPFIVHKFMHAQLYSDPSYCEPERFRETYYFYGTLMDPSTLGSARNSPCLHRRAHSQDVGVNILRSWMSLHIRGSQALRTRSSQWAKWIG